MFGENSQKRKLLNRRSDLGKSHVRKGQRNYILRTGQFSGSIGWGVFFLVYFCKCIFRKCIFCICIFCMCIFVYVFFVSVFFVSVSFVSVFFVSVCL